MIVIQFHDEQKDEEQPIIVSFDDVKTKKRNWVKEFSEFNRMEPLGETSKIQQHLLVGTKWNWISSESLGLALFYVGKRVHVITLSTIYNGQEEIFTCNGCNPCCIYKNDTIYYHIIKSCS